MKPAPRHDELRKQYEAETAQNPKAYLHWQHCNTGVVWSNCGSPPLWYENVEYRRKTIGHPHAELMAQYAEDAKTTDKPWGLWEAKAKGDEIWYPLQVPARWCENQDYRRKPVAQDFLVFCEISVRALSAAEAAWTFRELVASGTPTVGVQDQAGKPFHESHGLRPKGDNKQTAHTLLTKAYDALEEHSAEICEPNVDHIQKLVWDAMQLLQKPVPAAKPKQHTITLTTDQLKEVVLACEYPGWENEDFTSAVLALRIALWGEV